MRRGSHRSMTNGTGEVGISPDTNENLIHAAPPVLWSSNNTNQIRLKLIYAVHYSRHVSNPRDSDFYNAYEALCLDNGKSRSLISSESGTGHQGTSISIRSTDKCHTTDSHSIIKLHYSIQRYSMNRIVVIVSFTFLPKHSQSQANTSPD